MIAAALENDELLARLVAFDSTSSRSNLPIADFICDYLDHPGVVIERLPNPDNTKVNIVARVGDPAPEPQSRHGLILSGHLDVVPALEPAWQSDPFQMVESDTAYFGRGTCDMKGFVALAVNAFRRAADQHLRRPLVLMLTYDEELGTLGATHLADQWHQPFPLPKLAIVGEPTSLRAVRMHKGCFTIKLTFAGQAAHSGYPHLGINAIEPASRAVVALSKLRRELEPERCDSSRFFKETPFVSVNVGQISGGTAMNIIPDRCEMVVGVRLLPGLAASDYIPRFRDAIASACPNDEYSFEIVDESPPLMTDSTCNLYAALCELVSQGEDVSASYATDAGPLQSLGIQSVVWGPGDIAVAHKPNECLPKKDFQRADSILRKLVDRFCASPDGTDA